MFKVLAATVVVALFGVFAGSASAADFKNGELVAQKLERYMNNVYKPKAAARGIKLNLVLCAYTPYFGVECTATGFEKSAGKLKFEWTLRKASATRGKISTSVTVFKDNSFDYQSDIVSSTKLGLKSW